MVYVFLALSFVLSGLTGWLSGWFSSWNALWQLPLTFAGIFLGFVILFLLLLFVSTRFVDPKKLLESRAAISASCSISSAVWRFSSAAFTFM